MQASHNIIHDHLSMPISFIGLMGAGKSRIGLEVSRLLDKDFIDADSEIEKAAGCSIADIFERFGEAEFRNGEARVIARLIEERTTCVLATGGGCIMRPETAQKLHDNTLCVWLDTDMDVLLERTSRNDKRPLLQQGNAREILQELSDKRRPIYESTCHIRITGPENSPRACAESIIEAIAERLRQDQSA